MEYLIALLEADDVSDDIKRSEVKRLKKVYESLELIPGLTRRAPDSTEMDSMDNNGSTLAFSGLFDEGAFAKRMKRHGERVECTGVLERDSRYYGLARFVTFMWVLCRPWLWPSYIKTGLKPKFYWNNTQPELYTLFGWYGRSPGFLGLMDLAAQGYTSPFRWLGVLVGQFLGVFEKTGNTDARKLPYVSWYFLTKGTRWWDRWIWKLFYRLWVFILMKQYPNGMNDVYKIYYNDNHPIVTRSKRYF